MTELSLQSRRLIHLAREQDEAAPGVLRRVEQSLAARIAAGVGVGLATAAAAKSAVGAVFGVMAAKVGVVGTMVAATAGAGWLISTTFSRTHEPPGGPTAAALRPHTEPRLTTAGESTADTEALEPTQNPSLRSAPPPETVPAVAHEAGNAGKVRRPSVPAVEAPTSQLQAETSDLTLVQQALRSGRPAVALALLDQQDARHRGGALAQERAAARVLALCLAGETTQARLQAKRFERTWPRSSLLARVQSACGGQSR
ncbi:MAG: hypothetical protein JW940_02895 [Polyangiaceae bacterium]|nr:hypothetical protein [Polyangiaceae bacterium]